MRLVHAYLVAALSLVACQKSETPAVKSAEPVYNQVSRVEFNQRAPKLALPLFWSADKNNNNVLDPDELAVFWGLDGSQYQDWATPTGFTSKFASAYARIVKGVPQAISAEDKARQELLEKELLQSYFTVVESDFSAGSAEDKAIVQHVTRAAALVERIYQKQLGTLGMDQAIAAEDTLSRLVFFMNQGPWCSGPATENNESCTAVLPRPSHVAGLYPAQMQSDKAFCQALEENAELTKPFVVVTQDETGAFKAVPYTDVWKDEMSQVANELTQAAAAIVSPSEAAFKAYLLAAAQAFKDNAWFVADEAWAKMNAENSKWYLRIGPDEVYYEPCSLKAGFHVSFARINPGSVEWQKKLEPVKTEMEQALAQKAGKPYAARNVSFHLPDFIDVILNAGDSRDARGATIGQSLPNWGPVANEGRGRTVVMTNFYTDTDSKATMREQVESLFCKDAMTMYTEDAAPQIMSTVLHEAAHNLGPSHEYTVKGKTDDQVFGGPLASTLEELKAQTSALFFSDWLVGKNLVTRDMADKAHVRDVAWAMGHISRGMYDGEGKPKPYSQLAAIQMGFLMKEGALNWRNEELAANGKDQGCFALALDKFPEAINKLTGVVLGVKGRGDKKLAEQLKQEFVDGKGPWTQLIPMVGERYLRFPRASFLYSVKM